MDLRKCVALFLTAVLSAGPVCFAGDPQPSSAADALLGKWSEGWYEGADGYEKAVEEYEKTNKPMAVYVNVKWCPYCRKFENEVLADPEVQAFMKDFIKVRLDPEKSDRENSIAFQYGVMGFPSFYVHPPQPSGTIRLFTGVSPQQFIELFKKVLK